MKSYGSAITKPRIELNDAEEILKASNLFISNDLYYNHRRNLIVCNRVEASINQNQILRIRDNWCGNTSHNGCNQFQPFKSVTLK
jgi:hypothetical protein